MLQKIKIVAERNEKSEKTAFQRSEERNEIKAMFCVQNLGLQAQHEKDSANMGQDLENLYVIRCFRTPAMVLTKRGLMRAESGACFLKSPDFTQQISMPKQGRSSVVSDWLSVFPEAEFETTLNQLEIPTNVLIRGNRVDLLERDIKRILDERKKKLPYYENAIHIQIEALLIKLARAAKQAQMTAYERKYDPELISLRNYMYDTLEKDWCLEEMAQKLNISQSRFSIMYKEYFQVSPIKDLNKMRVERAKVMLLTSDMKLGEIAQILGFKNEYYFSKVFKRTEGIPPGKYRNEG